MAITDENNCFLSFFNSKSRNWVWLTCVIGCNCVAIFRVIRQVVYVISNLIWSIIGYIKITCEWVTCVKRSRKKTVDLCGCQVTNSFNYNINYAIVVDLNYNWSAQSLMVISIANGLAWVRILLQKVCYSLSQPSKLLVASLASLATLKCSKIITKAIKTLMVSSQLKENLSLESLFREMEKVREAKSLGNKINGR